MNYIETSASQKLISIEQKNINIYIVLKGSYSIEYITSSHQRDDSPKQNVLIAGSCFGDFQKFGGKKFKLE